MRDWQIRRNGFQNQLHFERKFSRISTRFGMVLDCDFQFFSGRYGAVGSIYYRLFATPTRRFWPIGAENSNLRFAHCREFAFSAYLVSFKYFLNESKNLFSFNQLCLPDYDSYQQLEKALTIAITEGSEGFELVWGFSLFPTGCRF